MAKTDKTKKQKEKGKDDGEPKAKAAAAAPAPYSSIATHPKAHGSVRRVRAITGLVAFAIAAVLSVKAQVPMDQVGLRALAAGVAGYMLAWWASMKVWRHLMIAEQRAAAEEIKRRRAERNQQAAASG